MADDSMKPPGWVRDAIFYQIFPDRFARSGLVDVGARLDDWDAAPTFTGYKGGDLWGVRDRLDYLVDLGITAIYLNPVFQSAANHRYHTHDYYRVDPMLGGDEAFDALIGSCHDLGMRVVLDGVFNHASRGFFQFSDVAEHQAKSAYVDWFDIHEFPIDPYDEATPAGYDAWWGLHALPKFNTENEHVREFLWGVGEHWIERGADGWRLDVPNEITTDGFWEEFRRRVRRINPEAYITGEVWGPAQEWVGKSGRFDAVMNYKLTTAIIAFAVGNRIDPATVLDNSDYDVTPGLNAAEFADRIDWMSSLYDDETRLAMLNLLDSHDTARILTIAGGQSDLVRLALVLLFVFPGAPCIYYGTEVGMEGGVDPDCRRGFPWDRTSWDSDTFDFVKDLVRLRSVEPALRSPVLERLGPVLGSGSGRSYLCIRGVGSDRLLVAVNHADEPDVAPLDAGVFPSDAERLLGSASVEAAAGDKGGFEVKLAARSFGIWRAAL